MKNLTDNLLSWYNKNKRKLPWRIKKNVRNSYYVWISEIMLQQTNVSTVINYYKKFISNWPTIYSLSKAKLDTILFIWQGLGYYNRAANLHKTAKIICSKYNGKIPSTYETLIQLPGIGEYTANAIMAIAYNKKTIGIDTNISRVVSRLYNLNPNNKKEITKRIYKLLPINKCSDFMQALMDVGAKICKKKNVDCFICPLKKYCNFYNQKKKINFDILKNKKKKFLFVYLIKYKNQIIMKKRRNTKFLHGLMEIPNNLLNNKTSLKTAKKNAPLELDWKIISGKIHSKISNFELEIKFLEAQAKEKFFLKNSVWVNRSDIQKIPISTLMKNILSYLNLS
ncbi:MAG: A/G-specific adenine glycosylase [Pelagibacteraceae bacterium]|nr:A/G-specific adenine glycosylase [Pelagibacteraceae bacterium]